MSDRDYVAEVIEDWSGQLDDPYTSVSSITKKHARAVINRLAKLEAVALAARKVDVHAVRAISAFEGDAVVPYNRIVMLHEALGELEK